MQSAIYLLGDNKEISEIFDNQIYPLLSKRELVVPDRTLVPRESEFGSNTGLLFALVGKDLEEGLSQAILEVFEATRKGHSGDKGIQLESRWQYTLKIVASTYPPGKNFLDKDAIPAWEAVYKRVGGPYSDEATASKLFVPMALDYMTRGVDKKLNELEERLKELASTTLADFANS